MTAKEFFDSQLITDANSVIKKYAKYYNRFDMMRFAEAYHKNEVKKSNAPDAMRCCDINCKEKAVFQVQDIGEGKTYEDYTHCCENHLAEMIGENTLHEVWRLKQ